MNEQLSGDIRALSKWLNEEPNEPIDRPALARVLQTVATAEHLIYEDGSPGPATTTEPVQVFLVRDVAALLGASVPDVCKALAHLGHGQRSTNMEITPDEALAVADHIRASDPTERKGEPVGANFASFKAKCDEVFGWVVGIGGYEDALRAVWAHTASPQVPPHMLGLTQGITGALNHLVLMIAGRAKAFPSLPLGRYLPEALHFAGLEMPSREACRPMTFNVPTVSTLTSAIAGALSGTWHCMRVWEAWHHGTMSEDDFEPVAESETPREIAEIVAGMYASALDDVVERAISEFERRDRGIPQAHIASQLVAEMRNMLDAARKVGA